MKVYGGGSSSTATAWSSSTPARGEGVSLDELYTLACLLREAQHEREAA